MNLCLISYLLMQLIFVWPHSLVCVVLLSDAASLLVVFLIILLYFRKLWGFLLMSSHRTALPQVCQVSLWSFWFYGPSSEESLNHSGFFVASLPSDMKHFEVTVAGQIKWNWTKNLLFVFLLVVFYSSTRSFLPVGFEEVKQHLHDGSVYGSFL